MKGLEVIIPGGVNSSQVLKFIKDHEEWISRQVSLKPANDFLFLGQTIEEVKNYDHWLYVQAQDYLIKRTLQLAGSNGFIINRVSVRRQASRWASCSAKKNISLNYRLMKYSREIIDYVIYHELCHLEEMNHSGKFWKLVEMYVPNYKEYRKILKSPV